MSGRSGERHELAEEDRDALILRARQVAEQAYAPYSHFRVGAALLVVEATGARHILSGCNVENASYGLTLCAERSALAAAVAQLGVGGAGGARVTRLAVSCIDAPTLSASSERDAAAEIANRAPCGACRQWIAELAPDAIISIDRGAGQPSDYRIGDLLPLSFRLRG